MQVSGGQKLLQFGEFQLDVGKKVLRREGEIVPLPLKAVELLCVLVENHGEVVSKADLMSRVWADSFVEDSVLTQNIYLLRKTLRSNGTDAPIKNVPRRGYVFDGPVGFARETIIERHLTERVEIEAIEEGEKATDPYTKAPAVLPRDWSRGWRAAVLSMIAAVVLLAAGAYYYFQNDPQEPFVSAAPPLKLKAAPVASNIKTLVVLPFKNSEESFSANFSSELSVRLGSMNKFLVKPFPLINEYARNGAAINTDFVLEGDLQKGKDTFLADVRLTDAKNNTNVWSGKFEYNNLIQLQDAIANRTAKELLDRLSDVERKMAAARLPTNFAAYQSFQTGYLLWRRRADGSAYLKKAIELDQSHAPAYAIMANVKATGGLRDSPAASEAQQLLNKAFALDENLPDAYAVQGFIRIFHHYDWEGAEKSLKNALELDPNNINAHHWLGVFYSIHRRLDQAKAEMHKALELDPTNPTLVADVGQLYYFAGENDQALEYVQKALSLDRNHIFANEYRNLIYSSRLGVDNESTIKQLEKASGENAFTLPYINVDPRYSAVREDKRFQKILRKMNIE